MKKILIALLALAVFLVACQLFVMRTANEQANNIASFMEKNQYFTLLDKNISNSLFKTDVSMKFAFFEQEIELNSHSSHILFFNETKGNFKALSEPALTLIRIFFGTDEALSFTYKGDELDLDIAGIDLSVDNYKFSSKPAKLKIISKDENSGILRADLPGLFFLDDEFDFVLESLKYELDAKNIKDAPLFDQKNKLSLASLGFGINYSDFDLNFALKELELYSALEQDKKNEQINAEHEIKAKSLDILNLTFDNVSLKSSLKGLDKATLLELASADVLKADSLEILDNFGKLQKLLTKDSQFDLEDFSFEASGGKFSSKLQAKVDPKNDKNILVGGELQSTKALSKMLGLAGIFISSYEKEALANGMLIADGQGYKMSFESVENDVIFNGKTRLSQILGAELLKGFSE